MCLNTDMDVSCCEHCTEHRKNKKKQNPKKTLRIPPSVSSTSQVREGLIETQGICNTLINRLDGGTIYIFCLFTKNIFILEQEHFCGDT